MTNIIEKLKEYIAIQDDLDYDERAESLLYLITEGSNFDILAVIEGRIEDKRKLQKIFYEWPIGVYANEDIYFVVEEYIDIILVVRRK